MTTSNPRTLSRGGLPPARRAAIGCMLNRLILLAAGNDAKLAKLFAHAELKRGDCTPGAASAVRSADWVTVAQNPQLRGGLCPPPSGNRLVSMQHSGNAGIIMKHCGRIDLVA